MFWLGFVFGDRAIGRPLNWPTVPLADPIDYDWISVKIFSILCNYNSHRIKSQMCIEIFAYEHAYYFSFERIQNKLNDFEILVFNPFQSINIFILISLF